MYCFKCGTKLEDGTYVCPACNQVQPLAQNVPLQYVFVKPKAPGKGCGIAGMVLGIVGLVYSFPILSLAISIFSGKTPVQVDTASIAPMFLVFSVFSILALCLAGSGRRQGYKNGISTSGIVMGIIGLAVHIISDVLLLTA